jgi:hypothetical protein
VMLDSGRAGGQKQERRGPRCPRQQRSKMGEGNIEHAEWRPWRVLKMALRAGLCCSCWVGLKGTGGQFGH